MTVERQLRFWLIGLALFLLALFFLRSVLLPFVLGMAPVVKPKRFSRSRSAGGILFLSASFPKPAALTRFGFT